MIAHAVCIRQHKTTNTKESTQKGSARPFRDTSFLGLTQSGSWEAARCNKRSVTQGKTLQQALVELLIRALGIVEQLAALGLSR